MKIEKKPQFLRKLNLLDSASLAIGGVIGSGIFMTAGFVAQYIPSPSIEKRAQEMILCKTSPSLRRS